MKPTSIFIITALFVALAACEKDEPYDFTEFQIEGLTVENYPRVDGSTSTNPLNLIIAAKLLNVEYEFYKGIGVSIPDVYYSGSTLWDKLLCSQTNGAILNLIDNQTDIITVARKMSPDERQYAQEKGVNLVETPIALDALDFIVNVENPVNSLTINDVASNETSIKDGTYPIIAPVYVMIRSDLDKNSNAYKLYQLLQRSVGKAVIEKSGYVPN
jgi:phosphate transport system substrate-binding protein